MVRLRTQILTFAFGSGLLAAGLSPLPFEEGLILAGTALASFAYGSVLLAWRAGPPVVSSVPGKVIIPSPMLSQPPAPGPALPQPANQEPTSVAPASAPSTATLGPTTVAHTPSPLHAQAPPGPSVPPASYGQTPSQTSFEKRKLSSLKLPSVSLPRQIIEHRVPISLIAASLPLIVAGLLFAGLSPTVALGYGLLIPGAFLFGIGGVILFLQLYRRPVGLRRFCMHCGFQMLTTEFACERCHKQPMSGIDTKVCPNCTAVIPALARFCRDCGAGQSAM